MKWTIGVAAVALLMLPAVTQAEPTYNEGTQRRIVEAAYDRLTSYTVLSEDELSFELSDFTTIYKAQFDTVRWLDVVSMPEGLVIDMNRARQTNTSLGESRIQYEPSWRTMKSLWRDNPETAGSQGMTIAEALAMVDEQEGRPRNVEAITSYTVTATLGDQSRTYLAAFLWSPSNAEPGFATAFYVADHTTQGVEEAVRESEAPLTDPGFLRLTGDLGVPPEKSTCTQTQSEWFNYTPYESDTYQHNYGRHYGSADFWIECRCDSACYSYCQGTIYWSACLDDDDLSWPTCHVMKKATDVDSGVKYGGGAQCAAALNCNMNSCALCLCGLSVGVKVQGVSVTFQNDPNHEWKANQKFQMYACRPCT